MRRKGISPLIAAVLLIAFTMAVASLFAQWAPQLIKNAQGDTAERATTIQDCSGVSISILDGANATAATVQQETGQTAVGNVSVTWQYDSGSPVQTYTQINSNRGLGNAYDNTGNGNTLTQVTATPVSCEGASAATWTNSSS